MSSIITTMKWRNIGWASHVALSRGENAYKILIEIPKVADRLWNVCEDGKVQVKVSFCLVN
jgi:hypothetical protein